MPLRVAPPLVFLLGTPVAIGPASHFGARMQNTLDLELIAQRVLKLAEIATLEHLQLLLQSQAQSLLQAESEVK